MIQSQCHGDLNDQTLFHSIIDGPPGVPGHCRGIKKRPNWSSLWWVGAPTHWPILGWNVSKSWLQKVDFFENYAIVAMQSDNVTFYACKIIKVTSGFNLKKTIFFARRRHHLKNSWNIFQIQITPLLWRPQGPQGCLEKQNYPLSLNLVVWCAKIGSKTQKPSKNPHFEMFFVISEIFWSLFNFGWIVVVQSPNLNSVDKFASLDTYGGPGPVGVKVVD